MIDIESLIAVRAMVADGSLPAETAGHRALLAIGRWRWEDGELVLATPEDTVPGTGGDLPAPRDNPALSLDAAVSFACRICPRFWPEFLRTAVSAQSALHHWHTNFSKPDQVPLMPRAVLLAMIDHLLFVAGDERERPPMTLPPMTLPA